MISIETIMANTSVVLLAVAVICTLISVITEFTKSLGFLKKMPTDLQVLLLSLIVCVVCFFAFLSYKNITFVWYYLVAVIFASFIIAIICTRGWTYLTDIWKKFYIKKD